MLKFLGAPNRYTGAESPLDTAMVAFQSYPYL